jgi:hypothetical protein
MGHGLIPVAIGHCICKDLLYYKWKKQAVGKRNRGPKRDGQTSSRKRIEEYRINEPSHLFKKKKKKISGKNSNTNYRFVFWFCKC